MSTSPIIMYGGGSANSHASIFCLFITKSLLLCTYLVDCISVVKDSLTITEGRDGGQYGFFIHPGESVALPFKYQSFGSSTPSFAGEDHLITINETSRRFALQKKSIKVRSYVLDLVCRIIIVHVHTCMWCDKIKKTLLLSLEFFA